MDIEVVGIKGRLTVKGLNRGESENRSAYYESKNLYDLRV